MLKSIVVQDIPLDAYPAMERWYYRDHSPEISRRYGPWLARHESYLPLPVPPEAQVYGFYNWRVTECYWRETPEPGPKGALAFTIPPAWPRVASCFVSPQPTEDFLGSEYLPSEKVGLRWYVLMRYPEGVSREEGDDWFLDVHAPEVAGQPGLYRFFSYRVIEDAPPLPGVWRADDHPPADITKSRWDRVYELWYETFSDWRRAVIERPPVYTKPPWATQDGYPFVRPYEEFVCSFILERPNDEFLRDLRSYTP